MEIENKKLRKEWIDIAKGIAIILVVVGHSINPQIRKDSQIALFIYWFIYFFHTRLLFLLSGITFSLSFRKNERENRRTFFVKKFKRLMIPYISYSLVIFILFYFMSRFNKLKMLMNNFISGDCSFSSWFIGLITGENKYSIHLWYIYALFIIVMATFILLKAGLNRKILLFITVILFVVTNYANIDCPYIIKEVCEFSVYFMVGVIFEDLKKYKECIVLKIFLGVSFLFMILFAYLKVINNEAYRGNSLLILIFSLGVCTLFILSSKYLEHKKITNLKYIGINSYGIYIFHQPILCSGFTTIFYKYLGCCIFISCSLAIVISIIFSLIISKVLKRILEKCQEIKL